MFKLIEKLFVVLTLLYFTAAILPVLLEPAVDPRFPQKPDGNPVELAIQTAFYFTAAIFVTFRWKRFFAGVRAAMPVMALVGLAVVSTAWSQDPAFTIRRSIVLLATTLFGVYFGACFDTEEQLRLLRWSLLLAALASLFFVALLPQYGVDHVFHQGDWQGAFTQKNVLGRVMVFGVFVAACSPTLKNLTRWCLFILFGGLLVMSGSRTAESVLLAMLVVRLAMRILRMRLATAVPLVVTLLGISAAAAVAIASNFRIFMEILGRDSTLTGRTDIWHVVILVISRHPLLGYGFNAFWRGLSGESADVVLTLGWMVPHAHNGFLDLGLELGITGVALFAIGWFLSVRTGVRFFRLDETGNYDWPLTYLILLVLYNVTESAILKQNNIFWTLYVATAVSLALARRHAESTEAEYAWASEDGPHEFSNDPLSPLGYLPG